MRHQQDRGAAVAQLAQAPVALLLKPCIADGEHFIDQQDVGVLARRAGKGQAERHSRGVGVQRPIKELADLGELLDGVLARVRIAIAAGDDLMKEARVLAAGEIG